MSTHSGDISLATLVLLGLLPMALRPDDPRSPSRQIVDELRNQIATGQLAPGDQLPSNAEMRSRYEVSNQTAQNAINALKQDELVYSVPGRGVFVRSDIDRDGLIGQLARDDQNPELYNDLSARLAKLGEAQAMLGEALADVQKRVEEIEERQGISRQADGPSQLVSDH